ncbi:MAG: DUF4214 domain-containing protein [Acetobacteraceae bacterium]|nr:DUF4214 domain-containing protein [Acetobacteraceae bacterium]
MSAFANPTALGALSLVQGFRLDGQPVARLGASVDFVGDVNGDGYEDLLVGAPTSSNAGAQSGSSWLVFGKAGGWTNLTLNNAIASGTAIRIDGQGAGDNAGNWVSAAGDVNADGFADFLIGAPLADGGGTDSGATWLIFGKAAGWSNFTLAGGLSTLVGVRFTGQAGTQSGWSAAGTGDVNGDGFADFIVGAPFGSGGGEAWLIFGKNTAWANTALTPGLAPSAGIRITGSGTADFTGWSVNSAGDLNGDGLADLAIGAPFSAAGGNNSGSTYVVFGKTGGWSSIDLSTALRFDGAAESQSGRSVASAGDVNGDGFMDLLIGAPSAAVGSSTGAGVTWLVFGKASGWSNLSLPNAAASDAIFIAGPAASANGGWAVSAAGDVNGDGFADLVTTAPQAGTNAGATYVILGRPGPWSSFGLAGTLPSNVGIRIDGAAVSDQSGRSVSAGDINGDGRPDLAIGAPFAQTGGSQSGAAWLLLNQGVGGVTYVGTTLTDRLLGTSADDRLFGMGGTDRLFGQAGNDLLVGGAGNDVLDGGIGRDGTVFDYGRRNTSVGAEAGGSRIVTGGGQVDTIASIEVAAFVDGRLVFDPLDPAAQVVRLYQAILNRQPDQQGLNDWIAALGAGQPLGALADAFLAAPEFSARFGANISNEQLVTQMYRFALGREPDSGGFQAWVSGLNDGTITRTQLLTGFSESPENVQRTLPLVQAGIWDLSETAAAVARMYDTTLQRLPDVAGLDAWRANLDSGMSLRDLAGGFMGSPEFIAKFGGLGNAPFVTLMYQSALRREPDAAGLESWVNALNNGLDRRDLVVGFSESAEHKAFTRGNIMSDVPGDYGILLSDARTSNFYGTDRDDVLAGSSGPDRIFGFAGNDLLVSRGGNDLLDGAAGTDTAVLTFGRRGASVGGDSGTRTVSGVGLTETLASIEIVSFVDGRLVFDPADPASQVTRLYKAVLDRAPDQGGLNGWIAALQGGQALGNLADAFLNSAEFAQRFGANLSNEQLVTQMYRFALGREPDSGGLSGWVNALNAGTITRADLLVQFSESAENVQRTLPTVQAGIWDLDERAAIIARLYDTTLQRAPDLGGLSGWRDLLAGGTALNDIAQGFMQSAEFFGRFGSLDNQQFVTLMYQSALRREPDPGGLSSWVQALEGGLSRRDLVVGFSESAEHMAFTKDAIMNDNPASFGILFA